LYLVSDVSADDDPDDTAATTAEAERESGISEETNMEEMEDRLPRRGDVVGDRPPEDDEASEAAPCGLRAAPGRDEEEADDAGEEDDNEEEDDDDEEEEDGTTGRVHRRMSLKRKRCHMEFLLPSRDTSSISPSRTSRRPSVTMFCLIGAARW
jgi:hypothetical protein